MRNYIFGLLVSVAFALAAVASSVCEYKESSVADSQLTNLTIGEVRGPDQVPMITDLKIIESESETPVIGEITFHKPEFKIISRTVTETGYYPVEKIETPEPVEVTRSWISNGYRWNYTFEIDNKFLNYPLYHYYTELEKRDNKVFRKTNYIKFANDPFDDEDLGKIVNDIVYTTEKYGLTKEQTRKVIIDMVQQIPYVSDSTLTQNENIEFALFPHQTLAFGEADCEDTSILLASLLKEFGDDTALLDFKTHMAVGIAEPANENFSDTYDKCYTTDDGTKYFYVETTSKGWDIGELPEEYADCTPTIYPLS